jgi:hypothetical protein
MQTQLRKLKFEDWEPITTQAGPSQICGAVSAKPNLNGRTTDARAIRRITVYDIKGNEWAVIRMMAAHLRAIVRVIA